MKVITKFDPPPIPTSHFDWSAEQSPYKPGGPVGYGRNRLEAIEDLLHQIPGGLAWLEKYGCRPWGKQMRRSTN
jgi:hypothetical protein